MPISEDKLRAVLEQHLEKYMDKKDYEHGNPAEAARNIKQLVDEFVEKVDKELDGAGGFLRPGLRKATMNYIKKEFKRRTSN